MPKMTLLEVVQKTLNSTNGDEVSSITDTVEAMQIANICEDVYFNLITNGTIHEHTTLLRIDALGDASRPNYMILPTEVTKISSFRYDNSLDTSTDVQYRNVKYVTTEDFINRTLWRLQGDIDVIVVDDFSGVKLLVIND